MDKLEELLLSLRDKTIYFNNYTICKIGFYDIYNQHIKPIIEDPVFKLIRYAPDLPDKTFINIKISKDEEYSVIHVHSVFDKAEFCSYIAFNNRGIGSVNVDLSSYRIQLDDKKDIYRLFNAIMKRDITINKCIAPATMFELNDGYLVPKVQMNSDCFVYAFKSYFDYQLEECNYVDFREICIKE